MIGQLIELIEDDYILASFLQLDALIEDFFYIRFASWRGYDFFGHSLEPIESLAAHSFWKNCYARAGEQARNVCSASAIIACAGPNSLLAGWVEPAGYELGSKAGVSCADLMCTGREPFACKSDNSGFCAGDRSRNFDEID